MLTDTPYETAAERAAIKQARRCAQLEMALEAVRVKLNSRLAKTEWHAEELRDLVTRIDLALESKT